MEPKDIEQIAEVINQAVEPLHEDLGEVKSEIGQIKEKLDNIDNRVAILENQMVTKSYLDDKLGDLSGDLVVKLRKEDSKVDRLAEILRRKDLLDDSDLKQLAEYQIFPKFNLEGR